MAESFFSVLKKKLDEHNVTYDEALFNEKELKKKVPAKKKVAKKVTKKTPRRKPKTPPVEETAAVEESTVEEKAQPLKTRPKRKNSKNSTEWLENTFDSTLSEVEEDVKKKLTQLKNPTKEQLLPEPATSTYDELSASFEAYEDG